MDMSERDHFFDVEEEEVEDLLALAGCHTWR